MSRLFDSLMREYPIQTFLFWRTKEEIRARAFMSVVDQDADLSQFYDLPRSKQGVEKTFVLDGQEMLVRPNLGLFTQPISFIGLPVVSVPVWLSGASLPIGVQIIAPPWREVLALRVARALEREGVVAAPVGRAAW